MSNVAISDMGVMLFNFDSTTGKYKYLLPIKAAPATGGAPSQIDATELDSLYKQNILDREETPAYEFDYNYTIANHKEAEETFDGKTNRKLLMMFQDKSGYAFFWEWEQLGRNQFPQVVQYRAKSLLPLPKRLG